MKRVDEEAERRREGRGGELVAMGYEIRSLCEEVVVEEVKRAELRRAVLPLEVQLLAVAKPSRRVWVLDEERWCSIQSVESEMR